MTIYIQWAALTAFWCWGFYNAFREGEILGKVGTWLKNHLPKHILKPTIACPVCLASVHGTIWYLIAHYRFEAFPLDFFTWILFIVSISGFNFVIKEHLYED